MRIAMISEHASPLATIGGVDSGGQNIYVAHVAQCLTQQGHEVDVFTRCDDPTLEPVIEVARGWRVVHVIAGPRSFVPKEQLLGLMAEFASFCEGWLRKSPRYDVIHANFFMSGWVGMRLKEAFGIPLVTTFHALGKVRREHQKDADAFPAERIAIEQSLAAHSDRIIAECPQDLQDLERLYGADPARMDMVPCGFDRGEFSPLPRAAARALLNIPLREFMVLQLGRMVPRKGIETVVRAMASPACADIRLRVVGGDCDVPDPVRTPEIGRLMTVARECGVADRVIFEGRKPRSELRQWYAAADVFVTTPWYEPFGITPLEAMACARAVIGSRVGGLQHSIEHGATGLLVPRKDHEALALAIASLRSDPLLATKMGKAGLERVRRQFTWESVARQLAAVFAMVCARVPGIISTTTLTADGLRGTGVALHPIRRARAPHPAIFLDKDGTLIEDIPYNTDPALLRFTPHAVEALREWRDAGYRLIIITNQSGLGLGLFDLTALERLHRSLGAQLAHARVPVDGIFACPHRPDAGCGCRKPRAGLLLHAAEALKLDLRRSWMIGDILDDIEAGHRAGCRGVLLDVGHETAWLRGRYRTPEYRCTDLLQAARAILRTADARALPIGPAGEAVVVA